MKMIMLMVVLGTILSTSVRGQNCTEVTACDGTKVTLGDGSCYTRKSPCDDGYSCSSDSCTARSGVCSRSTSGGSCPVCKVGCVPDCTGKQCGENGCGGFCGVCPTGEGCSNGVCSVAGASGTCSKPYELTTDPITASVDITVTGDTTTAVHIHTPSCNYLSASPEVFYKFTIPAGKTFGFDMRLTGYDTVLSLLKDRCDDPTYTQQCSDDATPPGNYGSAIYGKISEGTYFLQVDGYDSTALGPFELKIRFKENCQPLCDGAFCGSDGCGSVCGTCESYQTCNSAARCFNTSCVPKCGSAYNRTCGEDGCGGSCGTCVTGYNCYGASIQPDDPENNPDEIPGSVCVANPTCNHFNPTCTPACGSNEFCSTRCRCLHKDTKLPDFVVLVDDLINDMKTHKITVPSSSCTLIEKCVGGAGERNLLRFTGASANQGQADFTPPFPKTNPDQFTWGTCHQHYHYRDFMRYSLHKVTGAVVKDGGKAAFCMEDSRRHLDGPGVGCDKKYECGHQGIQAGWADSYGWSLDCSWLDVTGLPAGDYVVRLEVNPSKSIEEDSYTNNLACVRVSIPEESSFTGVPATLAGGVQVSCDQYNFNTSGAAPLSTALLLTLVASLALMIF